MKSASQARDCGQSAVETALTMPLTIFLVLGTIQLFMSMQARLMAHLAVARATRAGSVSSGDCAPMLHAALLALLPTFARTDSPAALTAAFQTRLVSQTVNGVALGVPTFNAGEDGQRNEDILWIDRLHPVPAEIPTDEEEVFDEGAPNGLSATAHTLEVRMIFWYPLRIPFVNWVFSKMALTQWNYETLAGANPLMPTQRSANWSGAGIPASIDAKIASELRNRDVAGHYCMPIQTTYSMHMMTPARAANFRTRGCMNGPSLGGY